MTPNGESVGTGKLGNVRLTLYGAVSAPLSVVGLPLTVYIPAVYGEMGVDLALMGVVLMLARFSDVATDPVIGLLSDRTRSRFGRRKPWLVLGVPTMMVSTYLLFAPPDGAGAWYFTLCTVAIYLAFTILQIPYEAWGAELSGNYHERSRITAFREQFSLGGFLFAVSIPMIFSFFGQNDLRPAMSLSGLLICLSLPVVLGLAVGLVPEPPAPHVRTRALGAKEYRRGLRLMLRNGPFVRVVIGYTGTVIGHAMDGGLSYFFAKHVLGAESSYSFALFLMIVAGVACVPLWRLLSVRIGKHMALVTAILWYGAWALLMPLLYFIPEYAAEGFIFLQVMKGMTSGAFGMLTTSMAADVVDIDTARSGEQRTGLYFAVWGLLRKATTAIAASVGLFAVALFGFDATVDPGLAGTERGNTFGALMALTVFYSVVPSLVKLSTLPFLWTYPLTEERQARIRRRLEAKAQRLARQQTGGG